MQQRFVQNGRKITQTACIAQGNTLRTLDFNGKIPVHQFDQQINFPAIMSPHVIKPRTAIDDT